MIESETKNRPKYLLLSSRPIEHSGMTKIELDIIEYNKNCIEFDVACGWKVESKYKEMLASDEVNIIKLPAKRRLISYMRAIYRVIKENKYELVYIHGNSSLMVFEALPSKLAGTVVMSHCHNTKPERFSLHYYLMKPLFNLVVDVKIACSKRAANWAYYGRSIVIANGIEIERFAYKTHVRERMRERLKICSDLVIGHIGTFNVQKNHVRLISIFERVLEYNPSSKLLLVGDGPLRDAVYKIVEDRKLADRVVFVDYADDPESYLQAMDVVIIPSLFEGFCLVALEAQTSGLPVLVSKAIPEEAIVTNKCFSLDLNDDDSVWANKAISLAKSTRRDMSKTMISKGCSYKQMMEAIRKELLRYSSVESNKIDGANQC